MKKKYQILIRITVFLSLFEIMYILTTNMPISFAQGFFMFSLIVVELIAIAQIWYQEKARYLNESLMQTWPLEHEEKKWCG